MTVARQNKKWQSRFAKLMFTISLLHVVAARSRRNKRRILVGIGNFLNLANLEQKL
jgi:hypothetical protein